jgi:hypothetical protein
MINKTEGKKEFSKNGIPKKKRIDSQIRLNLMVYVMEERHVYVILDIASYI